MIECLIRGNILLFQLFIFFDRDIKNYLPVIILICNYLWWPRYDLEVALSPGPSNYQVVEKNFYTLKAARQSVGNYGCYDWIILEWTPWSSWFNDYSKYNKKIR